MGEPMGELVGKRALVTGGSRGIGAAIALALAAKGADVAISYERSAERAAEVARAIEAKGRRAVAIQADSADPAAMAELVRQTVEGLGGLDILVNNAGIARQGLVAEMSLADIDALLDVNVRAAVLVAQAAIPHLNEGGRIVFIGSCLADRITAPGVTVYSMTKSAQIALTHGLARELGPRGITVNLVQPGATDTDMNPANGDHSEILRSQTPLGRYGQPEDVAAAVAFLASPAARQISGATLTVDGGLNA
ncbi:NAD(P)-dependent dehydrogenase (short-subunit alcohol dehydrogenase family) [Azospirillum brasilense]|uniref:NAD(P)-dependent dehydrogenase (Short-subunit alcohol dehydrogenase family) n=1 Tax=Azospirillum brasilense TaxID=192 RepID=A0A560CH95_AZOBR|nr:SDR family oxidoreductase [Azospirillum brasilense]TWA84233.1 NAD(P)-dependent dehydrogenase (short-subunit alcohol dehydrogenase family) [Azospirillum brasilense]